MSRTWLPFRHGRVFCTLYNVTCPVYAIDQVYTVQVTFSKLPEIHDHVKLVTLYLLDLLSSSSFLGHSPSSPIKSPEHTQ